MIGENSLDKKGSLFCQMCSRELVKEQNCYCWECMGKSVTHLVNRFQETSTNDQIHEWLRRLEGRMDEIERMLREIRINLMPIKQQIGEWASEEL